MLLLAVYKSFGNEYQTAQTCSRFLDQIGRERRTHEAIRLKGLRPKLRGVVMNCTGLP